ncbi:MAG: Lrp/AsnC family transcriptional regulator [Suipraeoptans sp.]
MEQTVEQTKKEILKYIGKNSKTDIKELSILLDIDEMTIAGLIAEMESEKVICGYHTLVNWEKLGIDKVTALIEIKVAPIRGEGFDKVADRVSNYPEVTDSYLISGEFDMMVILEGRTLLEVSQFVSQKLSPIEGVLSTSTHFILKRYKEHGTCISAKERVERMPVTP